MFVDEEGKSKISRVQAWTCHNVSRKMRVPDFQTHEGDKFVSPTYRPPEHPWYSFLLENESTPGPQCGRKNYVNEKLP
jgi:hypothetical protein